MKTKLLIPFALFAVCAVLATVPSASAETIELLQNGEGTTLDGWQNSGFQICQDGDGISWFGTGNNEGRMSQTVLLADAGLTEEEIQGGAVLTASVTVRADWGTRVCNVKVQQVDADGNVLGTETVMDAGAVAKLETTAYSLDIVLDSNASGIKWEMTGQDKNKWAGIYGPLFRDCSLSFERAEEEVPGGGEDPAESVPTALNCSTIVYRGQLNVLGTDSPATNATAFTKTMHFKVYDDEAAETPVWQALDQQVSVNRDGSFTAMFGDETLAALIATGKVTHVGVSIGPNAGQAIELKPRRALRPVAAVNRALAAEAAGKDPRVGNLVTENALAANHVTVSMLEVAGTVTAPGAEAVTVAPVVVGEHETLTLLRGDGMRVFSGTRVDLGTTGPVQRGQKVGNPAPSDGIALIASCQGGTRALRIPGVIQYCRKGEYARAPATEPNGVKVTFFPFVGK